MLACFASTLLLLDAQASVGHVINLCIAIQLPAVTDECVWYFLNFISDCTLGMVVCLAFLRLQQEMAFSMSWSTIQESGEYGNPPSYRCVLSYALHCSMW